MLTKRGGRFHCGEDAKLERRSRGRLDVPSIYGGMLKLSPIPEDQLRELMGMRLVDVVNDEVKSTETG